MIEGKASGQSLRIKSDTISHGKMIRKMARAKR